MTQLSNTLNKDLAVSTSNEESKPKSESRNGQRHFLYPLLNKTKRKQFKKIMEINCRNFNQKLVELSKNKKNSVSSW